MRRDGSRTIDLLIPVEGVSSITFRGFTGGDEDDWHDGLIAGPRALMCRLSGQPRSVFRALRFPDVERVLGEFLACCPGSIRENLSAGVIPEFRGPAEDPEPASPERNGDLPDMADYDGRDAALLGLQEADSGTGPYRGPPMAGEDTGAPASPVGAVPAYRGGAADFLPPEHNPEHAPPGGEHRPQPGQKVFPDAPAIVDPRGLRQHGPSDQGGMDLRDGD